MSEPNGQQPEQTQPEPLVSGHLAVYRLESGEGLLCFRPDGAPDEGVVRQPLMGMMTGPLVSMLTGQEVTLDMDGKSGRMLRGVAKVMGLG